MRRSAGFAGAAAIVLLALGLALSFSRPLRGWLGWHSDAPKANKVTEHYTCSMHPSIQSTVPGACPLCGMSLVQVSAQQRAEGVVQVDALSSKIAGIQTARVESKPMRFDITGTGRIAYDETTLLDITMRVSGVAIKLFVDSVGQRIEVNQPLFTLYSEDLYDAQREFVARGDRLTRERLALLGMSETQIAALAASREPTRAVTFVAPKAGYAIQKDIVEGAALKIGTRVFRIAATDKVWLEADVQDRTIVSINPGQHAKVTLDNVPGQVFDAVVLFVYPYLESSARTGRARLQMDNSSGKFSLRPGMQATAQFDADGGTVLQVPESAVLYTGPRQLVFVQVDEQHFRPQEVHVGRWAHGMYEVVSGLDAGQVVASSGTFLLAAEARINSSAAYWDTEDSAATPAPDPPPPTAADPTKPAAVSFSCPMHPDVQSPTPAKCPKCGMALEKAAAP